MVGAGEIRAASNVKPGERREVCGMMARYKLCQRQSFASFTRGVANSAVYNGCACPRRKSRPPLDWATIVGCTVVKTAVCNESCCCNENTRCSGPPGCDEVAAGEEVTFATIIPHLNSSPRILPGGNDSTGPRMLARSTPADSPSGGMMKMNACFRRTLVLLAASRPSRRRHVDAADRSGPEFSALDSNRAFARPPRRRPSATPGRGGCGTFPARRRTRGRKPTETYAAATSRT